VDEAPAMQVSMLQKRGLAENGAQRIQQTHEQQGPEEASKPQTLIGQTPTISNFEKLADGISFAVSSRKEKTESARAADWEVCDQCDASNPKLDHDKFCWPGTADYCEADPCDRKNPLVNRPGWWCIRGTSKVIFSSAEYKRAATHSIIHPNQPRYERRKFWAMYAIPPGRHVKCVPCDPNNAKVRGKWCLPKTADLCSKPCDPCDPENPDVGKPGWFCKRGTADVCVDEVGTTVTNYIANKFDKNRNVIEGMVYGAAIPSQSCNNNPWCVWGIVAAAIVVVVVTAGAAAVTTGVFGGAAFSSGSATFSVVSSASSSNLISMSGSYVGSGLLKTSVAVGISAGGSMVSLAFD